MAGDIVKQHAKKKGVMILPVDSEHNALFQLMHIAKRKKIAKLIITASGGPFLGKTKAQLTKVTPKKALAHPTWSMGRKISIDSATLMNKGLEVIEAHHLFDIGYDAIEVVVHPESTIHSMVETADGEIFAQLGPADMRFPILNALTYPDTIDNDLPRLKLEQIRSLTFYQPDTETFPLLNYAYDAGRQGGTLPAVLNAANEVAVHRFLDGEIAFLDIAAVVLDIMKKHRSGKRTGLKDILSADAAAREAAHKWKPKKAKR